MQQQHSTIRTKRPLMRYHGGKWKLADWIISHFPQHRIYVEPFGGGASVLLKKQRSYAEVYNDLDGEIVNLFRCVRDYGPELLRVVELTPFSRAEFIDAWLPSDEPIEQARRTLIRSFMGFSSASVTMRRITSRGGHAATGFRSACRRSGTTPAHDWRNYPDALRAIIQRMQGVVIECKDALTVMRSHDGDDTLHYVDPPYIAGSRDAGSDYAHELTDGQHETLLLELRNLKGFVILSGYRSEMYDDTLNDWQRIDRNTFADGARPRTESIWLSPNQPNRMIF